MSVIDREEWFVVQHHRGDYLRALVIDEDGDEVGRVLADLYRGGGEIKVILDVALDAFSARELSFRLADAAAFVAGGAA